MKQACTACGKEVRANKDGSLRSHLSSSEEVVFCPGGRKPKPKTVEEKADLYVEAEKYRVIEADVVLVFGSKPQGYLVRRYDGVWSCECDSRVPRCTHVVVAATVAPPPIITPESASTVLDVLFEPDPFEGL